MKRNDYLDTSDSYSYGLDLSKFKIDLPKSPKKSTTPRKRYVCIDLEMTEFSAEQRHFVPGAIGEVIQFGAVMLDENYNMISKFTSYVNPVFSSVTPIIQKLTGITNSVLERADDFVSVFDKFAYWRGEGEIITFCWSQADHKQLWNELEAKGRYRYDLFAILRDFVDLQQLFGSLVSSKTSVSLESAMRLLQMEYEGKIHTAYSDSFNTARILHKLFCTESLNLDFEYINPRMNRKDSLNCKSQEDDYSCSFASFLPSEVLAQFGWSDEISEENTNENYKVEENTVLLEKSPLESLVDDKEINSLCEKYKIDFTKWFKLAIEVMNTEEMMVVNG